MKPCQSAAFELRQAESRRRRAASSSHFPPPHAARAFPRRVLLARPHAPQRPRRARASGVTLHASLHRCLRPQSARGCPPPARRARRRTSPSYSRKSVAAARALIPLRRAALPLATNAPLLPDFLAAVTVLFVETRSCCHINLDHAASACFLRATSASSRVILTSFA